MFIERLQAIEDKFQGLEACLSNPEIIKDQERYQQYAREHAELMPLIQTFRRYQQVRQELESNQVLLKEETDEEFKALAREEIQQLRAQLLELEEELRLHLLPKDPNDARNILLEIRAGTGGEEAALFVADLFRMYSRYAENKGWKVEVLSHSPTGMGGLKEIIALISGQRVYSRLKFESGVHRVQRVPVTESQGRIHTSAVTVAILPEAEEVDVQINPEEIRVDVFRSSGPGGQSVNTTDSAVRVTHLPTGLVVSCQDEKSQHKNKAKALKVLRARLLDLKQREQRQKIAQDRKTQVGTGDRSERIRTYNFPQGRITDHRPGLTLYRLEDILAGNLDELLDALNTYHRSTALKQQVG
ncbi:MAG: peptide chain release factor 1 [Deltaproteobacteria bacterium]|nr:peptide chain release factor 1 [Deltaproteobacteria bacterium]MBW1951921.1 peptide chain release factor 1 [Deltaproteobacteria bacterium]MBW1986331.1 peptide chain release factor 1 [Deltaproteobacteria bacterium]MBW2134373.1 peptide chain release factor 1 [Deltaproteobacteria bacterium]